MLHEGSPSRSANNYAVLELKLILAAINQSTPTIECSPFTDSLLAYNILIASAANLTVLFEGSVSSNIACKCATGTESVLTISVNFYLDVALRCS